MKLMQRGRRAESNVILERFSRRWFLHKRNCDVYRIEKGKPEFARQAKAVAWDVVLHQF